MNNNTMYTDLMTKVDHLIWLVENGNGDQLKFSKPMDVAMAADYLNMTKQGIYNRVHLGTIPYHKNGKLFFLKEELDLFINGKWNKNKRK